MSRSLGKAKPHVSFQGPPTPALYLAVGSGGGFGEGASSPPSLLAALCSVTDVHTLELGLPDAPDPPCSLKTVLSGLREGPEGGV